jgi:hypothetical protein
MEFLSFPSAYHPDLHSKAADSWILEIQIQVSADRLPRCQGKGPSLRIRSNASTHSYQTMHGPIVIEFRPPLLGVLGAYCAPAMSGRKTQEHPARPQAQHERSYKPE